MFKSCLSPVIDRCCYIVTKSRYCLKKAILIQNEPKKTLKFKLRQQNHHHSVKFMFKWIKLIWYVRSSAPHIERYGFLPYFVPFKVVGVLLYFCSNICSIDLWPRSSLNSIKKVCKWCVCARVYVRVCILSGVEHIYSIS